MCLALAPPGRSLLASLGAMCETSGDRVPTPTHPRLQGLSQFLCIPAVACDPVTWGGVHSSIFEGSLSLGGLGGPVGCGSCLSWAVAGMGRDRTPGRPRPLPADIFATSSQHEAPAGDPGDLCLQVRRGAGPGGRRRAGAQESPRPDTRAQRGPLTRHGEDCPHHLEVTTLKSLTGATPEPAPLPVECLLRPFGRFLLSSASAFLGCVNNKDTHVWKAEESYFIRAKKTD